MAVAYDKLWKMLIDKKMTKTQLRLAADISTATLAKLSKEEPVSMDVMLRICCALKCNISEVMDVLQKEENV